METLKNEENLDILNTVSVSRTDTLKRKLKEVENSLDFKDDNDTCSATKISKNISTTEVDGTITKISTTEVDGTITKISTTEVDGTITKISTTEVDGTITKISTTEVDGTITKISTTEVDGTITKISTTEVDGTITKISTTEVDGTITKTSKSSSDKVKPLTSREKEIEFLENILCEHADTKESTSLYISGQPGTGKTASLSYVRQLPKVQEGYKQVYINCTMMISATSIYNRICKELHIRTSGTGEKACLSAFERYLSSEHKMILLVLDEIDQLESKWQSVLYTIFEWPSLPASRLVLIGIANALDLTERTLPRLQARRSLRPRTLHFAPYTKDQIINIFTNLFATEDKGKLFSPVALQMLAAKIAAISGDMRRALDLGRRVIELAKRSKFKENKSIDTMMQDSTVTVELKQVLEVLNNIYGGSSKMETDVSEEFPMHQKLILCTLLLMLTKGKNKDIALGKLHDVYKRVAKARNIAPLAMGELLSACTLLEAHGAVRLAGNGDAARMRRLRLQWDEAELTDALKDKPLLSAIMADTRCLSA